MNTIIYSSRIVYLVLYIFSKVHYIFSKGQQNKSTKMN